MPNLYQKITSDAAAHLQIRRTVFAALFASLATNLALAAHLLTQSDETRTVVIAPDSAEPYIAMSDRVSPNLLERFAVSSMGLILNVTPQTGRWQTETFLKYVAPESYSGVAAALRRGVEELERNQATVAFFPHGATVDEKTRTVCLTGERRTMIGRAVTNTEAATACLSADVRLGRLWIVEMRVSDGKTTAAQAAATLAAKGSH